MGICCNKSPKKKKNKNAKYAITTSLPSTSKPKPQPRQNNFIDDRDSVSLEREKQEKLKAVEEKLAIYRIASETKGGPAQIQASQPAAPQADSQKQKLKDIEEKLAIYRIASQTKRVPEDEIKQDDTKPEYNRKYSPAPQVDMNHIPRELFDDEADEIFGTCNSAVNHDVTIAEMYVEKAIKDKIDDMNKTDKQKQLASTNHRFKAALNSTLTIDDNFFDEI